MGRSATNVVGNSIATVVVGKWEGEYDPKKQDEMLEGVEEPEEVAQPA
jgi:aerobic C4-dicarboxylate transport protein